MFWVCCKKKWKLHRPSIFRQLPAVILTSVKTSSKRFEIFQKPCWQINRLKITDLQSVHVFRLKISLKNFTTLFFFPVKAEMLLFSNLTSGGHHGGHGSIYFNLKFWKFWWRSKPKFWKGCPPDVKFEKSNISALTGKKINVVKFFHEFLQWV